MLRKIKLKIFRSCFVIVAIASVLLFCVGGNITKSTYVSGEESEPKLAILMYHGFSAAGKESTYVRNVSSFEKDLIFLKESWFEFVTTKELINFCDYGVPLPQKAVMLTFDDGYLNNYAFAYPLLQKYNAKAVVSPIAYYSDYHTQYPDANTAYAHMTWEQLSEMSDSGTVDVQNHSYNMHSLQNGRKGSSKATEESEAEYRQNFFEDLQRAHCAIKKATGKAPVAYAYPFGSVSKEAKAILKCCGYRITFSCAEGYNIITRSKDSLYMLKRFNRTPEKSASQLLSDY